MLRHVALAVYPDNTASVRVLHKLGLRFERTLRLYGHELHLYA